MFIHANNKLINSDTIAWVDYRNLPELGYVRLHYTDDEAENVEGAEAVDIVMRLCPAALEGKPMKYLKHRWVIHNLFGHPLLQLLSWLGLTKLGLKIHDRTVPGIKND